MTCPRKNNAPRRAASREFCLFARKHYHTRHQDSRLFLRALGEFIEFELSRGREIRFKGVGHWLARTRPLHRALLSGKAKGGFGGKRSKVKVPLQVFLKFHYSTGIKASIKKAIYERHNQNHA